MKIIEIVGLDSFYDGRYGSPTWIKQHRSMLFSYQFSQLSRGQISAFFALVWLGIECKNEISFDIVWMNKRTWCKLRTSDIELFQALNLIKIRDSSGNTAGQNRIEENRKEKNRLEKNKQENITSFFSEIQNPKTPDQKLESELKNPANSKILNPPVKEKLISKYENLSHEEIEAFKKSFGMDPSKYISKLTK